MTTTKKIYFASDLHLGAPDYEASRKREDLFIFWLTSIKQDCEELYLLGDVFDFWYEYKKVVPKGHVRLLAKIAEFTDENIPVFMMRGNHDMWMFDYLEKEIGVKIINQPYLIERSGKKLYLAHGDGLGPNQRFYKFIRTLYYSRWFHWVGARLHPNFGVWLAEFVSRKSRESHDPEEANFLGEEKEYLLIHSNEILKEEHFDYFIYGHRHMMLEFPLSGTSKCINLGDWLQYNSYAVFDGQNLFLKQFNKTE